MVLNDHFQDVLDLSAKCSSLNLPTFKDNALKIEFVADEATESVYDVQKSMLPFAASDVHQANIVQWRKLTADHGDCKPIYEVTLDVTDSNFKFTPGDTIGIIPHNNTSEVDFVISHLGLEADLTYSLSADKSLKAKVPSHIPVKSTLRHVLTHCVELRGILKKMFILALSKHTKDENERKVLEYFCSKEGSTVYNTQILNKGFCILDIFTIFKTCKPPIEVLFSYLPRLFPRPYSIVNSHMKNPNVIKICFSVMDLGNGRKGVTTSWLEDAIMSSSIENIEQGIQKLSIRNKCISEFKVPIYLRKNMSGFSLPEDTKKPLILIGPGTGVAPYIGFLEERSYLAKNSSDAFGKIWLFFGCKNPKLDYIYEKELNDFKEDGTLDRLTVAFSRVEDNEVKYVQDSLLLHGEELVNFIKDGAAIFICGDLKTMASQVREVIVKCLVIYDGRTQEDAEKFVADLQKEKRYFVDVWS